jgi:hypothetical protein
VDAGGAPRSNADGKAKEFWRFVGDQIGSLAFLEA